MSSKKSNDPFEQIYIHSQKEQIKHNFNYNRPAFIDRKFYGAVSCNQVFLSEFMLNNDNNNLITDRTKLSSFEFAVINGRIETVEMFLNHGITSDNTLYLASIDGHVEIVKLLLNAGQHQNIDQALKEAEHGKHKDVIEELKKYKKK
jgi:ankyrin repeat protein